MDIQLPSLLDRQTLPSFSVQSLFDLFILSLPLQRGLLTPNVSKIGNLQRKDKEDFRPTVFFFRAQVSGDEKAFFPCTLFV